MRRDTKIFQSIHTYAQSAFGNFLSGGIPYGILQLMTKGTLVFLLGLVTIILPTLGVPLWWKQIIFGAMGIVLLGIGYSIRRSQYLATLEHDGTVRTAETFVETTEPLFDTTR